MRIAITGGSGSLGRALIRRLCSGGADRIVTITRDEHKRVALASEFEWHPGFRAYAADVRDERRLVDVFAGCEVVVHAAARKVVSGHHDEPREMLATNVLGTQNVLYAARQAGVSKLLFISSDKAVEATNAYGMSKALAEQLVVSENARSFAQGLRCGVLRYGNVLGSNGSVLGVWRRLAAEGQPIPVSDVRMTRFWLPLEFAVDCVVRAVADLRGGEVFVPWVKAAPLLSLVAAAGLDGHPVRETGIRPGGEKLHEKLVSEDERRRALRRDRWLVVPPPDTSDLWDRTPWLGEPWSGDYCSHMWIQQWTTDELAALLRGAAPVQA